MNEWLDRIMDKLDEEINDFFFWFEKETGIEIDENHADIYRAAFYKGLEERAAEKRRQALDNLRE